MLEFGNHVGVTKINPEFHLLPKYQEEDISVINRLKKDAGRFIRNNSCYLPKIKIKAKRIKSIIEIKNITIKSFGMLLKKEFNILNET